VDVRYGLEVGGRPVDIAVTEDRTSNAIRVFRIEPEDRSLTEISDGTLAVGYSVYGCGLYRSPRNGEMYFFVGEEDTGRVDQFHLTATDKGKVTAKKVRTLKVGTQTEGIVADDENGFVFIGEELRGLWRFDAEPDGATTGVLVSEIGPLNPIKKDDLEGLTIYKTGEEKGYLLASSQGSNEYVVFDREAPHKHLGTYRIIDGAVDGVSETDGIEVTSRNLGAGLETGLFVAQDGDNPGGHQNFKLVPWSGIAKALNLKSMGDPAN
jgi:3-phytase